jgi:thymidylate synthase (FAD)
LKITPMEVTLIDSMGSDLSVVNAARVSFHKESEWEDEVFIEEGNKDSGYGGHWEYKLAEKDAKLINYLAKHGHWTPFGHAFLSFRIKAPIFVARQLVKHQVGLCWNEVSRRYVDDEPEFWLPGVGQWRGKPVNAKQGSAGIGAKLAPMGVDLDKEDLWGDHDNAWDPNLHVDYAMTHCLDVYNQMILGGVAPEQARMVLPLNSHTEWIWSGSLAAFARVCNLRLDPHAQAETREVAEKINASIPDSFRHSWGALLGSNVVSRPSDDAVAHALLKNG